MQGLHTGKNCESAGCGKMVALGHQKYCTEHSFHRPGEHLGKSESWYK